MPIAKDGIFVLPALVGGAAPAVAVVRIAVALFAAAAILEIAVNMARHRDMRVRSRLSGLMREQRR